MSKIQRWGFRGDEYCDNFCEIDHVEDGDYILHADIVEVFKWMVKHEVTTEEDTICWYDEENSKWEYKDVNDGDYLAAIVGLMGGEE